MLPPTLADVEVEELLLLTDVSSAAVVGVPVGVGTT